MSSALPPCPHRPPCPGCPRYGSGSPPREAWRGLCALATDAGLPEPAFRRGEPLAYRQRARLAVRGRSTTPKLGIFQLGSHRIVDIPRCGVHHPRINEAAGALKQAMRQHQLAPNTDASQRGLVCYVQVAIERSASTAQLVIVTNQARPQGLEPFFATLAEALGPGLHSLWWNGNDARTNTILGPAWEHVCGPAMLVERVAGIEVFYPPGAFMQSHFALAERIAAEIRARVPTGCRVAELYAGSGAIGLGLLGHASHVSFNELDPHGLSGLDAGLAARPETERARASIRPGPAGDAIELLGTADVVIVDPPRKGLDEPLLRALCERPRGRLLYLSCGWTSLIRECEQLRAGGWHLRELQTWDLFPYTEHLETLAVLDAI
jgi:tRNA/tmRNA/rRNA uracil-C5-methylase (TrmA/RlmC/RlmD family)